MSPYSSTVVGKTGANHTQIRGTTFDSAFLPLSWWLSLIANWPLTVSSSSVRYRRDSSDICNELNACSMTACCQRSSITFLLTIAPTAAGTGNLRVQRIVKGPITPACRSHCARSARPEFGQNYKYARKSDELDELTDDGGVVERIDIRIAMQIQTIRHQSFQ